MILVTLMASGANATPEQIRQIKWMLLGFGVGGLLCLGVGLLLVFRAHPIIGGTIGAIPLGVVCAGIVWVAVSQ